MNNITVGINDFVRRQIKGSGKTYSLLSYQEIAEYGERQLNNNNFLPTAFIDDIDEQLEILLPPYEKPLFLFELKFESTLQEDRRKLKKFKEENWEIKTNEIVSKHMYNIPPETPIGEYKCWEEENTKLDDF